MAITARMAIMVIMVIMVIVIRVILVGNVGNNSKASFFASGLRRLLAKKSNPG